MRILCIVCVAVFVLIQSANAEVSAQSDRPSSSPLNYPSYFGINGVGYFHRPNDAEQLRKRWELMKELGAKWDRSDFWWHDVEPEKGKWTFEKADRGADMYRDNDVQMFPILNYGAAWRRSEAPANDEQRAEWAEYVRRVVPRYKGLMNYWEVWNEPNIIPFWRPQPNVEDYAKLLKLTAEVAREGNPDAKIVGFTLADQSLDYLERALQLAGTDCFDVFSYHFYRTTQPELRTPDEVRELQLVLEHFGKRDCPIWVTEFGVTSHIREGLTEQMQAVYLMRQVLALIGAGVERVFPFCLVDNAHDPGGEWGAQLGIVGMDWRRKPAFHAYKTMIAELSDYRLSGHVFLRDDVQALLFEHRDPSGAEPRKKLVAWSTEDVVDVRVPIDALESTRTIKGVMLHNAKPHLTQYRTLFGEELPVEFGYGYTRVMLSPSPVYIPVASKHLENNAATVWERNPVLSSPGRTEHNRLRVAFEDVPATGIQYKLPEGWSAEQGQDFAFIVPQDATPDWYTVRAQIPTTSGTIMKDLRVWVRPDTRVEVRPYVTTSSEEIVTSFTVNNLNVTTETAWSFSSKPALDSVGWPSGKIGGNPGDPGNYYAESSVRFPKSALLKLKEPMEIRFNTGGDSGLPGKPAFQIGVHVLRGAVPTVDGNLGEFRDVPKVRLGYAHQSTRGRSSGPDDAMANVAVIWTKEGIYVGADVTDANPMMNDAGTGGDVYKGDGVEVYIGPGGYSGQYYAKKETGYRHFCLTPGKAGIGAAVSDFERIVDGSQIAVAARAGGYVIEAFIPRSAFGDYEPNAGDVIAWDVQLNDRDDYSAAAQQKSFMWNGDDMNWLRAAKWGLAVIK